MAKGNNNSITKVSGTHSLSGANIPVISFAATADTSDTLSAEEFDIRTDDGRLEFAAFYDSAHKLIFVLDKTIDVRTPNTLLVISPDASDPLRKWDDILANDYELDLETVRPKVDNKYQKLDIEYTGLPIYNRLINAHNSREDLTDALRELSDFRTGAARRAALARLDTAEDTRKVAADTIDRAKNSIEKTNDQIKVLTDKLKSEKKRIGKEPAKQSAAKILKLESQIEAAGEKIQRSEQRIKHAEKRLEVAATDAAAARKLLGMEEGGAPIKKTTKPSKAAVKTVHTEPQNVAPSAPIEEIDEDFKKDFDNQPAAPTTDIKPLIEKDPEIIDETIAFRPISFDAPMPPAAKETTEDTTSSQDGTEAEFTGDFKPLFTDSVISKEQPMDAEKESDKDLIKNITLTPPPKMTTDSLPQRNTMADFFNIDDDRDSVALTKIPNQGTDTEISRTDMSGIETIPEYEQETKPMPIQEQPEITEPAATPAPTIPEQPVRPQFLGGAMPLTRPASPNLAPSEITTETKRNRPSAVYYIMLIVLIALSIFTLWLYQNRAGNITPDIAAPVRQSPELQTAEVPDPISNNPFIIETIAEQEQISDTAALPPTPAEIGTNEVEIVPMQDMTLEQPLENTVEIQYTPDEVLAKAPETTTDPVLCEDGTAPDIQGCCTGERFTNMGGDQGYGCCNLETNDCFPPLF